MKSRTRSGNGIMSRIGIESWMESRIENGARIKMKSENECGTKRVTGTGIENDSGIEINIDRHKKKFYIHAGAAEIIVIEVTVSEKNSLEHLRRNVVLTTLEQLTYRCCAAARCTAG
ncbi:hypothetical protein EVAR_83496_1 [Eumeta japonica]|uniref:Uncharacterized protein n=1 Tax=Eumeta variegata TaxID=151549 RepID=A0A4C1Y1B2_EUMVA|nr:hypothetical protein EVAR_83496_1 [Eumeta japonica]